MPVAALLVRGAGAQHHRPIGPGRVDRPLARAGEMPQVGRLGPAARTASGWRSRCRFEVPVQSLPVSPPPMMITCLPVASESGPGSVSP